MSGIIDVFSLRRETIGRSDNGDVQCEVLNGESAATSGPPLGPPGWIAERSIRQKREVQEQVHRY